MRRSHAPGPGALLVGSAEAAMLFFGPLPAGGLAPSRDVLKECCIRGVRSTCPDIAPASTRGECEASGAAVRESTRRGFSQRGAPCGR